MYLEDRKDYYYPNIELCEEGCTYLDYDEKNERIKCQCDIKNSTYGYETRDFIKNERVEEFNIPCLLPNIQVLKCVFKMKLVNFWQLIGLILFIALFATIGLILLSIVLVLINKGFAL